MTNLSPDMTLVAYSEIALKSRPVRRYLENLLVQHIRTSLRLRGLRFDGISRQSGRIFVVGGDPQQISKSLREVFGIEYSCPVLRTAATVEKISDVAVKLASDALEPSDTFAIDARRTGTHPFTSKDLENKIGASVLQKLGAQRKLRVDLENPRKTIFIEVRDTDAYLFTNMNRGAGGLPYGSQGKLVAQLGEDHRSAVASWLMMKRGAAVTLIHVSAANEDKVLQRTLSHAKELKKFVPHQRLRLLIVSLNGFDAFSKKHADPVLTIAFRNCVTLQVALETARRIGAYGVGTADPELSALVADYMLGTGWEKLYLPIYRPLLGLDDEEVAQLAQKIGITEFDSQCAVRPLVNGSKLASLRVLVGEVEVRNMIANAVNGTQKINV